MATTAVFKLVERALSQTGFAGDMIRSMADYPGQQRTVSGYRRTGGLGRGWKIGRRRRGKTVTSIEVLNRVRYAVHVQGPRRGAKGRRQTREMRRRGWPNITTESKRVWRRHRPGIVRIITQRDPRVRRRRSGV
jgi:hypothetical protein